MKYEKIITRSNNSEVRIVVTGKSSPLNFTICPQVDVFTRKKDGINWQLCVDKPGRCQESLKMSVDQFLQNGRHPMFYLISHADILKAVQKFREIFVTA